MRESVIDNLAAKIDRDLVNDLVSSHEELLAKYRAGDLEGALTKCGRFVDHSLRVIEFIRSGRTLPGIKSVQQAIQQIENDTSISDSLRFLIPRVANAIYGLRSKRDAVHVNEIDPSPIDVALATAAASWILAEFLRLYHSSDSNTVQRAMMALSRTALPLIDAIGGETFVSANVPALKEILLLLGHAHPHGMSRKEIGLSAKCSPPSVTKALQALVRARQVHRMGNLEYHITSTGESELASWLMSSQHQAA